MLLAQHCMNEVHLCHCCIMFVHFYCCIVTSCVNILQFIPFTINGNSHSFQTLAVSKPATDPVFWCTCTQEFKLSCALFFEI